MRTSNISQYPIRFLVNRISYEFHTIAEYEMQQFEFSVFFNCINVSKIDKLNTV